MVWQNRFQQPRNHYTRFGQTGGYRDASLLQAWVQRLCKLGLPTQPHLFRILTLPLLVLHEENKADSQPYHIRESYASDYKRIHLCISHAVAVFLYTVEIAV